MARSKRLRKKRAPYAHRYRRATTLGLLREVLALMRGRQTGGFEVDEPLLADMERVCAGGEPPTTEADT